MINSVTGIATNAFALNFQRNQSDSPKLSDKEKEDGFHAAQNKAERGERRRTPKKEDPNQLTEEEKKQVEDLKKRDQEVRTHEAAHLAAAGDLAKGGPNYQYQTGPDGRSYAIGGNVQIDTSKGRTPEETISKAQRIRASALAPADPSPQDMRVAAMASRMEAEAVQELRKEEAKAADEIDPERIDNRGEQESDASQASPFALTSASQFLKPSGEDPEDRDRIREAFASRVKDAYAPESDNSRFSVSV